MKKTLLVVLVLAMISLLVLSGCQKDESQDEDVIRCPFDNAEITQMPIRPVVITIDNSPAARPQTGLVNADLLYELPAEGGISRILAVFYHETADKIGPVRSARPYLVDVAKEWQAVYVHVGGSMDALNYLSGGDLPYINEFSYGNYFWRDTERRAPHNLYTSSENLWDVITEQGWDEQKTITAWPFLAEDETQLAAAQEAAKENDRDSESLSLELANVVQVDYSAAKNTYQYDAVTGDYKRFVDDEPYCDAESGEWLSVKNVIVQYVSSKVLDSEGRLVIDMIGEGDALLFSDGIVLEGSWVRESVDSRTKFIDQYGNEWKMASGKTWIQVADQTVKVKYEQVEDE